MLDAWRSSARRDTIRRIRCPSPLPAPACGRTQPCNERLPARCRRRRCCAACRCTGTDHQHVATDRSGHTENRSHASHRPLKSSGLSGAESLANQNTRRSGRYSCKQSIEASSLFVLSRSTLMDRSRRKLRQCSVSCRALSSSRRASDRAIDDSSFPLESALALLKTGMCGAGGNLHSPRLPLLATAPRVPKRRPGTASALAD